MRQVTLTHRLRHFEFGASPKPMPIFSQRACMILSMLGRRQIQSAISPRMRASELTSGALVIGSCLRMAYEHLMDVKKLEFRGRNSPTIMVYAAENILTALFTSEGINTELVRKRSGNHQLEHMLDHLNNECSVKPRLEQVVDLVAYATTYRYPTPSGKLKISPPEKEAKGYYDILVEVLQICTAHFQVNVKEDMPIAGNINPIR